MANFNNDVDNFISKINFVKEKEEKDPNLFQYDTIIYDADDTLWDIRSSAGNKLAARDTVAPYRRDEKNKNIAFDSVGNVIKLKNGLIDTLRQLKFQGKSMYVVSSSYKDGVDMNEQPVMQILACFGILNLFEDVIIDDDKPKSDYIDDLDSGNSVFLDNEDKNLIDVSLNTNVETIDVKEHPHIFSWYKRAIQIEAGSLDPDSVYMLRKKIEEDKRLADRDIYTHRNDDGELVFRVNLKNGELIQINQEYKKKQPHIYEGMLLPKRILEKLREAQHENYKHFNNRLRLLEKERGIERLELQDESFKDIFENDQLLKQKILESSIISGDDVDENKLEEFLNNQNVMTKFIAGVAEAFLFFKEGGAIHQLEAKNLAEQIANYEVFGDFNGEEKYRSDNDIDYIPYQKTIEPIDGGEYVKQRVSFSKLENVEELAKVFQRQFQKMNYWIQQGMYMYDNPLTKQFSEPFKKKFGHYIEQCALVDSLSDKIYYKMKKMAGEFIK